MDAVIATDRLTKRDGAAREIDDVSIEVAPGDGCLADAGLVLLIIGAILIERRDIRHESDGDDKGHRSCPGCAGRRHGRRRTRRGWEATRRNGLPEGEARRRLDHDGRNVVPEQPPVPVIVLLARQFIDSMVLLLLGAAAISFAIGEGLDGAIILAIVVLNGVCGSVQEGRAQQAARAVRALLEQRTVVVRGGRPREIETAWVVLGDVVVLGSGDRVPADGRIVAAAGVEIDESVLTGRRCRASSGRIHRRSRAQGSVTVPRWPAREPWCPGAVPGSSSPPLGRGRRWMRSPSWPGRNDR